MLDTVPDLFASLGIPSGVGGLIYLLVNREAHHRKLERDAQIDMQNKRIESLERMLETFSDKHFKQIYERLTDLDKAFSEIKGYMRGKDDKSK